MQTQELTTIEKSVFIRAPRSRVWKALTDTTEFAKWFRVMTKDQFRVGARTNMASTYPGHEGEEFFTDVEEMQPEHRFSWRWKAAGKSAGEPGDDDVMTTVVFELEEVDGGTMVKVTESGFDQLSAARRARAFHGNEEGWTLQLQNLREYAASAA
jgi:uncharacterized protein YndB with AHSA1/START domain